MSEHSKEPWTVEIHHGRDCTDEYFSVGIIRDESGREVVSHPIDSDEDHNNFCRIVACVNACRGISTEVLERKTFIQALLEDLEEDAT